MQRLNALAGISEDFGKITRTYGSPAMRQANKLVAGWMRDAGMAIREDPIGNLIGHYAGSGTNPKILLLGSHLDTVRNGGKFDGPLGVILAISCVQQLRQADRHFPFAIEVVGFCDEEGVRFQSTYLGSRAFAGTLTDADLERCDARGISCAEAIREFGGWPADPRSARIDPNRFLGYVEAHIEQGPVLQAKSLPVGIVSAINGQTRARVRFFGRAAHAGTTPMTLRRDALVAAAQFVLMVDQTARGESELVATVGQLESPSGASNVVPGEVNLTLDVRHPHDENRVAAVTRLRSFAEGIQNKTGVLVEWQLVQETNAVTCSVGLTDLLMDAAGEHVNEVITLPSGAGHDAAALAAVIPVAMLFVRCKDGISHHPDESASLEDIEVALNVMNEFLQLLAQKHAGL